MARYLVTGGGGFIGSNIVEELVKQGEYVRVLDNFSTGRRQNINAFLNDIELIEGDICSYHTVQKAVNGIDFVLHQAALPSVPRSISDPITSNKVNVEGTLNLLHASKDSGVKRLVYASSSSVYGDAEVSPKVESLTPMPKSPYAVSKLTSEYYCKVFYEIYGLETVALRYFNVFGPRQDPNSQYSAVIPKFLKALKKNIKPVIYGDGAQSRDFTYVQNNVKANLLACDAPKAAGKVFNIACGDSYSLLDLVNNLNSIINTDIKPEFADELPGDVKHSLAGIEKAKEELLYKVEVDFATGLSLLEKSFEEV